MARIDSAATPQIVVTVRPAEGAVVWLRGDHDWSSVATLTATMARAIALDDDDLVVDLSGVTFMGAATVDVFVRAREYLGHRSRSLVLRDPSSAAQRIIQLCGLADLIAPQAATSRPTSGGAALGTWIAVPAAEPASTTRARAETTGRGEESTPRLAVSGGP